jgi:hypothetical protein
MKRLFEVLKMIVYAVAVLSLGLAMYYNQQLLWGLGGVFGAVAFILLMGEINESITGEPMLYDEEDKV